MLLGQGFLMKDITIQKSLLIPPHPVSSLSLFVNNAAFKITWIPKFRKILISQTFFELHVVMPLSSDNGR
jgi:hypothetical protein